MSGDENGTGLGELFAGHSVAWLEQRRRLFVRRKFSDGGRKEANRYTLIVHIGNRLTADPRDERIAEKFISTTYKKCSRDAKIYMRTSETSILTEPADAVSARRQGRKEEREFEEARDGRIVSSAASLKPVRIDDLYQDVRRVWGEAGATYLTARQYVS